MRRRFGFWFIFCLLVIGAAVDIAMLKGWFPGFLPQPFRNETHDIAIASRIDRIASGRDFAATLSAAGISRLVIDNPGGSVVVQGTSGDEIELQAWLIVYTKDETESKQILDEAELTFVVDGGTLQPRFDPDPATRLEADAPWDILWEISVPADLAVEIENSAGPVIVRGLTGALQITNDRGRVDVSQLSALVGITLSDGILSAVEVDGPMTVHARNSEVDLHAVSGGIDVEASNSYVSGSMLQGDSRFDVTSSRISLNEFSGDLTLRSADGTVDARTRLEVGALDLDIARGVAVFEFDVSGSAKPIHIRASSARVALIVPQHLLDHTLDLHLARGTKVYSEWNLDPVPADRGLRYSAQLGRGTHPFRVEAEKGARVDLGIPWFPRNNTIIEHHMVLP